jgi:hypothetical protein
MEVTNYAILTIKKGGSRYSAAWYPSVNPSSSFVETKRKIGVSQNSPWYTKILKYIKHNIYGYSS